MSKLTKSPRLNSLLYNMGIYNEYQIISLLPKRYENFLLSDLTRLEDKQKIVVYGKVSSLLKIVESKKVDVITFDFLTFDHKYFKIVAFNRKYLLNTIKLNDELTISGVYNKTRNEIEFVSAIKGKIDKESSLKPIYNLPNTYPNHLFASLVKRSLEGLKGKVYSLVPSYFRKKYSLLNKEEAINVAHNPKSLTDVKNAYRYLKYEEALLFSLKNKLIKETNRSFTKIKKEPIGIESCDEFISSLPYSLSEDQIKASEEIINDMNDSSLMYRMLQGDVGTGKTVVSFISLFANYKRGDQGALMAPTDALAKQHYQNALEYFKGFNIKIALLVGSTKVSKKKEIYRDLEDGLIDIVIGTHALFAKSIKYSSLGLVIIDEQHRFGVNQRVALASKGTHADMLMMSATPIPRSLALTLFGDLDISTLYTFPNKKRDVRTIILESDSERIYKAIDLSLNDNKKVYIVAPLIDFSENGKYSVEKLYARFALKYGKKVGLLHGKMNKDDKEKALLDFYQGITPILVSTQVIEVGIDVKSANLMIIYDASNFGLASLHQLRGRVGRDGSKAYCILTHDGSKEEEDKISILTKTEDGFEIAEADLKNRGPGELTGIKQSGLPDFHYLNIIDDFKIFTTARDDAQFIINNKNDERFKFIVSYVTKAINEEDKIKG